MIAWVERKPVGFYRTGSYFAGVVLLFCWPGLASIHGAGDMEFQGQLSLRGGYAWISTDSILNDPVGDSYTDQSVELRLMPKLRKGPHQLELHYEAVALASELLLLPGSVGNEPLGAALRLPDDSRRLFDLTHIIDESGKRQSYHRLDRLVYRHSANWGSVSLGREAITWGNGLVFNPMDLCNPFAPTDIERDYKLGDDLLLLNCFPDDWNGGLDWQLLVVPRRNLDTGNVRLSESSIAVKAHMQGDESEWEFLAAFHYDEAVLGAGHLGYLGNAVWRWDTTVAFPQGGDPLWSTVANIDYSWNWKGINYYGSLEIHYNTAGTSDYDTLPMQESLLERIQRGEMHTLGRAYFAPSLQMELHPLVNLYVGAIVNLDDPSAVLLPRLVWNVRQNMELTIGGNCYLGGDGTEFGGLPVAGIVDTTEAANLAYPDRLYLWVKAYF